MRKSKTGRIAAALLAACLAAPGLAGCKGGSDGGAQNNSGSDGTYVREGAFALKVKFKDEDTDDSWSAKEATNIALSGETAQISGNGASAEGSKVTISKAGTYVLSGSLSDGQIYVEAGDEDLVRLVLNGVALSCSDSAPIYIANADKTVLILAEGSENTITDGDTYTVNADEEPNAAVFSKDDLTINGTGALTVTANYNNGIGCKDDLKLVDGQITVNAKNHAIRGNDSVAVKDGSYTITAGGQGVKTSNETDSDKGYIYAEGGSFTIDSEDDGLHSNSDIALYGGSFTIASGDDAIHSDDTLTIQDGEIAITKSNEGLESAEIYISGGDIRVVASDDGINASGGGQTDDQTADAQQNGQPADRKQNGQSDGQTGDSQTADAQQSGQIPGEGMQDNIPGGGMRGGRGQMQDGDTATSSAIRKGRGQMQDGTQNGQTDGQIFDGQQNGQTDGQAADAQQSGQIPGGGMRGNMGGGMMESSTGYLQISGGTLYVDADGDGLDSNGDVEISGGDVVVSGPTNDGNGSLDYGGSFIVTGGRLTATGSSGMAAAPTDGTTVNTIFAGFDTAAAGSTLKIVDSDGKEIMSVTPEKTYSSLVYSDSALKSGETYTITIDGETAASVTISDTVTSTGNISSKGGMGGGMRGGRGQMQDGQIPEEGMQGEIPRGGMQDGQMTPPDNAQGGNGTMTPPDNAQSGNGAGGTQQNIL